MRAMRSVFARDNSGGEEVKTVRPRPVLPKSFSNKESREDSVILGEFAVDLESISLLIFMGYNCKGN